MANIDATHAYGGALQPSFHELELDLSPAFIDNNIDPEEAWAKEPYLYIADVSWLQEPHFFREAFLDSELDDSTLAADDASFTTGDDASPALPHIKTEETKPTLTLDCRPPTQQWSSQHLTPTSPLARTPSKRQRSDLHSDTRQGQETGEDTHVLTRKRSKRGVGAYPCPSCSKPFDRECDLTKHHKHTHIPKDKRRHACEECGKRFCWPKDLRRHCRQVQHTLPSDDDLIKDEKHVGTQACQESVPRLAWPKDMRRHLKRVAKTVLMLQTLRIKATSPKSPLAGAAETSIQVTVDKQTFVKVDVSRLADVADLRFRIAEALGYTLEMGSMMNISRYHRTYPFEPLSEKALMEVVENDADADMNLKLQVSIP